MRRPLAATATTVAGIALLLSLKPHHSPLVTSTAGDGSPAPSTAPSTAPGTAGPAKANGTFTGSPVETRFGPVQVQITVKNGALTGVTVLQVPQDHGRDREIAAFSVPILTREALAAGNAEIDTVSGATYTSEGYIGSLQSALDAAGV